MSNLAITLLPETLRSLAFGSISGTYAKVGTPLVNPSRLLYFLNTTDVNITLSWDGTNDHFIIVASGFLLLDLSSNKSIQGGVAACHSGTQFYIKGSPSLGNFYISTLYASNG